MGLLVPILRGFSALDEISARLAEVQMALSFERFQPGLELLLNSRQKCL